MELTKTIENRIKKVLKDPKKASESDKLFFYLQYNKMSGKKAQGINDPEVFAEVLEFFQELYAPGSVEGTIVVVPTGEVEIIARSSFDQKVLDALLGEEPQKPKEEIQAEKPKTKNVKRNTSPRTRRTAPRARKDKNG